MLSGYIQQCLEWLHCVSTPAARIPVLKTTHYIYQKNVFKVRIKMNELNHAQWWCVFIQPLYFCTLSKFFSHFLIGWFGKYWHTGFRFSKKTNLLTLTGIDFLEEPDSTGFFSIRMHAGVQEKPFYKSSCDQPQWTNLSSCTKFSLFEGMLQ